MPAIVDFPAVKQTLEARGFVSLYHNSGAFGFPPGTDVWSAGWIEVEDATIRPAARKLAKCVASIIDAMAAVLVRLPGEAWLMPKSHWHYELHFGNRELLEGLLPKIGIDAAGLRERNDGSAISFGPVERRLLMQTIGGLLEGLQGSDFMLALPDAKTVCTIHHHRQVWWQTADELIHPILIG